MERDGTTSRCSNYECKKTNKLVNVLITFAQIVAAAEISLTKNGSVKHHSAAPLYAGQPISAFVTIRTSFGWGPNENLTGSYTLRYDIEEMVRDWLLSGPKRGEFEAKVGPCNPLTRRIPSLTVTRSMIHLSRRRSH